MLAGNTVTTHESTINYNGWIGAGYLAIDPSTGAGAYIISGGFSGGATSGGASDAVQWSAWLTEITDLFMPEGGSLGSVSKAFGVLGALLSGKAAFDADCGFGAIYGVYAFAIAGLALGLTLSLYFLPLVAFGLGVILSLAIAAIQARIIRDFC